jgi:hypothetical protein
VTTLSAETGRPITVASAASALERHLAEALGYRTSRRGPDPESFAGQASRPVVASR